MMKINGHFSKIGYIFANPDNHDLKVLIENN